MPSPSHTPPLPRCLRHSGSPLTSVDTSPAQQACSAEMPPANARQSPCRIPPVDIPPPAQLARNVPHCSPGYPRAQTLLVPQPPRFCSRPPAIHLTSHNSLRRRRLQSPSPPPPIPSRSAQSKKRVRLPVQTALLSRGQSRVPIP